jgi:DNA polymerase III subunit delta'
MSENAVMSLLQRSLERNRLAHAYLFTGNSLSELEAAARKLAKALNCAAPPVGKSGGGPLECCEVCDTCRRIEQLNHPDALWVRPESKSRVITIDQMRELLQTVSLKPMSARYKVAVVVAADRLNSQAANAFLKTLEEPPPNSILLLLSTEPQRMLETILSRCLRLSFGGNWAPSVEQYGPWLTSFSEIAARSEHGLLDRYRLLGMVLKELTAEKAEIEKALAARSPLERYDEMDPKTRDKLEQELTAAIEAEYRRTRADLIGALHWWLRDVWLQTVTAGADLLSFPNLKGAADVAKKITSAEALANLEQIDRLQRQLNSNVQEALALEVGLLKLKL